MSGAKRADGTRRAHIDLPRELYERADQAADSLDMTTTAFICRVLDGAMRGGSATRLALLDYGLPVQVTRAAPKGVEWVSVDNNEFGTPGVMPRASKWLSENGYVLERFGPIGGRSRTPGGWVLVCPDGDRVTLESRQRPKAQREAEAIMRRRPTNESEEPSCTACG